MLAGSLGACAANRNALPGFEWGGIANRNDRIALEMEEQVNSSLARNEA
jgi:hypothetical protein